MLIYLMIEGKQINQLSSQSSNLNKWKQMHTCMLLFVFFKKIFYKNTGITWKLSEF